jgi:type I restriction enzyme S subunit
MSEWQECKLGDIGVVVTGKTPSSKNLDDFGHDIPFVTPTDYRNYHKAVSFAGRYLSYAGTEKLKNKILPPQSVMVTCIGSDMGKVAINSIPVVTNQQINSIISNISKVDPDFLYYKLVESYDVLRSYGLAGTALPIVNKTDFEGITVLLPPLPEQRAIAGVLSSLDDKTDLLHRQNKTLEGMAEALWRKMFVEGADPGWKKGRLGDVVEETIGGDWGEDIQSNDLIPVICLRGVDLQHIKESGFSSEAPIRFIKPTSLEKRKLNENEILIAGSGIGPIGKSIPINSAVLKCYLYPVIYSNFCKRLRAESKEMAYFIEFMIYQFYKEGELDQFHMGTSVPNFNLKDLLNYEITIPPRDIISFFSSLLTDSYTKKFTNQIRTLSRLRDTLLPKLMSGEVRVKL